MSAVLVAYAPNDRMQAPPIRSLQQTVKIRTTAQISLLILADIHSLSY